MLDTRREAVRWCVAPCASVALYLCTLPSSNAPPSLRTPAARATRAVVSLLSVAGFEGHTQLGGFVDAAERLGCSLAPSDAHHDRLMLVVDPLRDLGATHRARIEASGWTLVDAPCLPRGASRWSFLNSRYNNACLFSKLWLWALSAYTAGVLYVDLDMLALRPDAVPRLFADALPLNASGLGMPADSLPGRFNAGLLLLRPEPARFGALLRDSARFAYHELAEQAFLNAAFAGHIQALPAGRVVCVDETRPLRIGQDALLLHYISNYKPWWMCGAQTKEGPLADACALWARAAQCSPDAHNISLINFPPPIEAPPELSASKPL